MKKISAELAKQCLPTEYERSTVVLKEWAKHGFHSEFIEMIMCFLL